MNTYTVTHQSPCPKGGLLDCYHIEIRSDSVILVETILETMKNAPTPIFQEHLADHLRNTLGAEITVTGWHHGIFVTCNRK